MDSNSWELEQSVFTFVTNVLDGKVISVGAGEMLNAVF